MIRSKRVVTVTLIAFMLFAGIFTAPATAFLDINLGSLIRLFGIGYVVDRFGPQINDAVNTITFQRDLDIQQFTAVVPIISGEIGAGGAAAYIGAAQVSGPRELVHQVRAVAQIEADWQRVLRAKVLVPVDSINPLNMRRISGVGVSAILDIIL